MINYIHNNVYEASWIISEVMLWGCSKNYRKEYEFDYKDVLIIKIVDKYFKYDIITGCFEPIKPKKKTIIYFD